jgi:tape measure domain-containing protein
MLAANMQQTKLRLELLSKEYGENAKAQELASRAAKKFGLSQQESLSGITDIYARLRPIGISLKEIETTYMGFNIATKLAGVNAAQASGAFLQLSQALGSGRLQGDEYRSIAEQLPTLTQAIAKQMGKPIGQLKKLASEGKITSDVVIKALQNIESEGGASIDALMKKDATQQFKNLQNAISDLSAELGEYLVPATVAVAQALTEAVRWVSDLPEPVKASAVAVGALTTAVGIGIPLGFKAYRLMRIIRVFMLRKLIPTLFLTKAAMGPIVLGLSLLTVAVASYGNKLVEKKRAQEDHIELLKSTDTNAVKSAIGIYKETEALRLNRLERAKASSESYWGIGIGKKNRIDKAQKDVDEITKKIKELEQRLIEIPAEEKFNEIKEGAEKVNQAMLALGETTRQTSDQFQTAFSTKFQNYLTTVNDFGAQAGSAVVRAFQGMEDALVKFVQTGKLNFSELANSIIADLIRIQVRQAFIAPLARMTGGWFSRFGGGGGGLGETWNSDMGVNANPVWPKAAGGPVNVGSSYLVGERGPELFTPNSSGTITANDQLGGGMVINVDASGSAVEGDANKSRELGELIGAAVQAEIGRQQRPGGMLY